MAHVPTAHNAVCTLVLVLQPRTVGLRNVAMALSSIEPLCAALCIPDPIADEAVLPHPREVPADAIDNRDDLARLSEITRRFHETLVERCGNETLILLVGAMEALWSGGQWAWDDQADPDLHTSLAEAIFRVHEGAAIRADGYD